VRVRLHIKSKPNNYTESLVVKMAGGWRERNVVVPGEVCVYASKEVNVVQGNKAALNTQKSAEAIVVTSPKGNVVEGLNQ
jgi:hypothetical protein